MIGIVYLKLHLSLLRPRFKIGVAGLGRSRKRFREIQRSTPGIQVPVFFTVVPFPYMFEAFLHDAMKSDRKPLRRGSGRTEWFALGFMGSAFLTAFCALCVPWVMYYLLAVALMK